MSNYAYDQDDRHGVEYDQCLLFLTPVRDMEFLLPGRNADHLTQYLFLECSRNKGTRERGCTPR